jgi:hypothetical protein
MPTLDLTKNPKQADYFNKILGASQGVYPYKYFGYGGAIRGGKTYVTLASIIILANKFKGSKWHVVRNDMPVLQSTTIPSFEKLIRGSNNWKPNRDKSNYFFYNRFDSKIFFKGENIKTDPELLDFLGLETNGIFLEQAEEITEKMWEMAIQRSGSWYIDPMPPAFIFLTFNPSQTWVKDKFYVPWIKGELKQPYYFESALPKDNPFVTNDQWDSWTRMADRYQKQFVEGDWTDFADKDARWAFAYDKARHVGHCGINFNYPVFLSFDFNRNPICCTIIQHYDETIFIPYCIKLANSNIYALCDYILTSIPGMHRALFIVGGDATGQNSAALVKDNLNYYTVIKQKLNLADTQFKVPTVNPRLEDNQVLVNSLLSNYNWIIDEDNAKGVIYDFENVRMLPQGTIDKSRRDDPTKQADAADTISYWCQQEMKWFLQSFASIKKNNTTNIIQQTVNKLMNAEYIECTRDEYKTIRPVILDQSNKWIISGNKDLVENAISEVRRLDEMFK